MENIDLIAKDLVFRSHAMAAGSKIDATDKNHLEIDSVVRQILNSGSQLMKSCASLAHGTHELALNTLLRSIIEIVIKTHWVTLSQDNAVLLQNAGKEQLKTVAKINLKNEKFRVVDKFGNNHSKSFLANDLLDKKSKIPSIETMASKCGLSDIYNIFYRFLSIYTHVNELNHNTDYSNTKHSSIEILKCVGLFSILLGHLGVRWLVHRNRPNNEEIRALLGLDSQASL